MIIIICKENLPNSGLRRFCEPKSKSKRKRTDRLVPRPCWRTKKNKLWNKKTKEILILIGVRGKIPKALVK